MTNVVYGRTRQPNTSLPFCIIHSQCLTWLNSLNSNLIFLYWIYEDVISSNYVGWIKLHGKKFMRESNMLLGQMLNFNCFTDVNKTAMNNMCEVREMLSFWNFRNSRRKRRTLKLWQTKEREQQPWKRSFEVKSP